jgi:4'-phosphopantetheinyl transferase
MSAEAQFQPIRAAVTEPRRLEQGEVHLWSAGLEISPARLEPLAALLSEREQARAARYRFERHRRRYQVTWGLVRSLLGHYISTDPHSLHFSFGPKGKPELTRGGGLQFNISHSAERVVVAVASTWPVGVDVEQIRPMEDAADIARRFFSPNEVQAFEALEEAQRLEGFFNCWTRKEALIKAVGEGVFVSLDRFDVSLTPGEPAQLVALDGQPADPESWHLTHLEPEVAMVGALATPARPDRVRGWAIDLERQSISPPG